MMMQVLRRFLSYYRQWCVWFHLVIDWGLYNQRKISMYCNCDFRKWDKASYHFLGKSDVIFLVNENIENSSTLTGFLYYMRWNFLCLPWVIYPPHYTRCILENRLYYLKVWFGSHGWASLHCIDNHFDFSNPSSYYVSYCMLPGWRFFFSLMKHACDTLPAEPMMVSYQKYTIHWWDFQILSSLSTMSSCH